MGTRNRSTATVSKNTRARDRGNVVRLVPREELEVPDPPADLRPAALTAWHDFWRSDAARAAQPADHRSIRRWAEALDQIERLNEVLRKPADEGGGMFTQGSHGQPRLNPLISEIRHLEAVVERAEDRHGMNAQSRMRLGIDVEKPGAGGSSGGGYGVDAMNRALRDSMDRAAAGADGELDGFEHV